MITNQAKIAMIRAVKKVVKDFTIYRTSVLPPPLVETDPLPTSPYTDTWTKVLADPQITILSNGDLQIDCEIKSGDLAEIPFQTVAIWKQLIIKLDDDKVLWKVNLPDLVMSTGNLPTIRAKIRFKQLCS